MLFVVWVYRQVFHCCRRIDNFLFSPAKKDESIVPVSTVPWLWIGARYADGVTVEYTNEVNNTVDFGLRVTPEWLDYVFNEHDVQWRYLDPKTLEEKDFPSEGFVIDDSVEPDPEDSADE